uniref:Uncharacterized protein n=1 Tax=Chenopodium quinoa TaxID=63459 RepID=A0A803MLJ0_CHEQI
PPHTQDDSRVPIPESYAGTVDFIQNQEPLPSFESCRSRLKLAERTIKNCLAKEGGTTSRPPTALVSTSNNQQSTDSVQSSSARAQLRWAGPTADWAVHFFRPALAVSARALFVACFLDSLDNAMAQSTLPHSSKFLSP